MDATCAVCGTAFEAKTCRAKYCSGACKKRAADVRSRTGQVIPMLVRQERAQAERDSGPDVDEGPLESGLRSAFKADDLTSPAGLIALRLCSDVDRLTPGVPGYASVVAQMRAAVDELRSQARPKAVTPLALIRERRAADRAASAG